MTIAVAVLLFGIALIYAGVKGKAVTALLTGSLQDKTNEPLK